MHTIAPRSGRRAWTLAPLCLFASLAAGCAEAVADSSACRNLVYKDGGLTRKEYLPCAGEMIALLDDLGPQSQAALRGDDNARSEGRATLRKLQALVKAAGGRNLLERWKDKALTDLNVDISNAVMKYEAFYMLPIEQPPHPYAAKTREAAEAELSGATRRHEEARSLYRQLR